MEKKTNWSEINNQLEQDFTFKDFKQALLFMVGVGMIAEGMNHHPTFENTYNKVKIRLSTHDAGDVVTDKDLTLSNLIDKHFKEHNV